MLPRHYWNVFQSPSSTWAISSPRPFEASDVIQNKEFFLLYKTCTLKIINIQKLCWPPEKAKSFDGSITRPVCFSRQPPGHRNKDTPPGPFIGCLCQLWRQTHTFLRLDKPARASWTMREHNLLWPKLRVFYQYTSLFTSWTLSINS